MSSTETKARLIAENEHLEYLNKYGKLINEYLLVIRDAQMALGEFLDSKPCRGHMEHVKGWLAEIDKSTKLVSEWQREYCQMLDKLSDKKPGQ